jgi:hypothetical protein
MVCDLEYFDEIERNGEGDDGCKRSLTYESTFAFNISENGIFSAIFSDKVWHHVNHSIPLLFQPGKRLRRADIKR